VQGPWDAAWGFSGTQLSGRYELCIQQAMGELYQATGIAIGKISLQPAHHCTCENADMKISLQPAQSLYM
jgi:hypothetical protein